MKENETTNKPDGSLPIMGEGRGEGPHGVCLFDKIWNAHVVQNVEDGPTQLYIDRLYAHEVTSPQAFDTLRDKNIKVFRPDHVVAMPDHNTPSDQQERIDDPVGRKQVETLKANCEEFGIKHFAMGTKDNGIIHVVGPEKALSLPGMTIVCGDSHTSTHGAVGAIAMGIGTSEVAQVLASQCILQSKPKTMRINIEGTLPEGTTAKDVALYIMAQMTTSGATGYAVEYAGSAVRNMSMEGRLTLSNLSIEMGSRAGLIAPDETTFAYLKGREYAPKGEDWDKAVEEWKKLYSDPDAVFDKEVTYRAEDIAPRITYGTNPGAGIAIDECIPTTEGMSDSEHARIHAVRTRAETRRSACGLLFPRCLHQWPHRRLPCFCLRGEGQEEGRQCGGLARAWLVAGASANHRRGHRQDTGRGWF